MLEVGLGMGVEASRSRVREGVHVEGRNPAMKLSKGRDNGGSWLTQDEDHD